MHHSQDDEGEELLQDEGEELLQDEQEELLERMGGPQAQAPYEFFDDYEE